MPHETLTDVIPAGDERESTQTEADEMELRKPAFVEGRWIRLADGRLWSFPARALAPFEPEYDALLEVIVDSECRDECLRGELALAIHLLNRNYTLRPVDYRRLLGYRPDDPRLAEMQEEFHDFVVEQVEDLSSDAPSKNGR